jgi:hypothetical protein
MLWCEFCDERPQLLLRAFILRSHTLAWRILKMTKCGISQKFFKRDIAIAGLGLAATVNLETN